MFQFAKLQVQVFDNAGKYVRTIDYPDPRANACEFYNDFNRGLFTMRPVMEPIPAPMEVPDESAREGNNLKPATRPVLTKPRRRAVDRVAG